MKTNHFTRKRSMLAAFALVILACTSIVSAADTKKTTTKALPQSQTAVQNPRGGQEGNGGAGIIRGETRMTFGSAGIIVDPVPKSEVEVPYLMQLVDSVIDNPLFTSRMKNSLVDALLPSKNRMYYNVESKFLDEFTKKRVLAEYSRIIQNGSDPLVLFAVTDTSKRVTFLFPDFYQLKPVEQMAILFHEAYWILRPRSTYEEVIRVEAAIQKYLENPNDKSVLRSVLLGLSAGYPFETLVNLVRLDTEKNAQTVFKVSENERIIFISDFRFLLGSEYNECLSKDLDCRYLVKRHWNNLRKNYSNSATIDFLESIIRDDNFNLSYHHYTYSDVTWLETPDGNLRCTPNENSKYRIDCVGVDRTIKNNPFIRLSFDLL